MDGDTPPWQHCTYLEPLWKTPSRGEWASCGSSSPSRARLTFFSNARLSMIFRENLQLSRTFSRLTLSLLTLRF
jgi:hypothetical protein